jgi:hypothetical protein
MRMGFVGLAELPRLKCLGRPFTHSKNIFIATSKYNSDNFHFYGKIKNRYGRKRAVQSVRFTPVAMVNVDVSPSVILGVGLIGAGVSLWQIRQARPWISRDYDVVVSCISLLVGGILIFQGWRLDPLLLFGQLMTTGAAVSFGIEALRLRSQMYEQDEKVALQDAFRRKSPRSDLTGNLDGNKKELPELTEQSNRRKRRATGFLQDDASLQYSSLYDDYVDYVDYRDAADQNYPRYVEADYYEKRGRGPSEEYADDSEPWYADGDQDEYQEEEEYPTDGDWSVRVDRNVASQRYERGSSSFAKEDWE